MKRALRDIGISLAVCLMLFGILDGPYIWKQAVYLFGSRHAAIRSSNSPAAVPLPKSTPNFLQIPALDISTPVVYVDGSTENDFQAGLKNGAVHYPGTALPGQSGNCYIFGHSSDYIWSKGKYKTVFALLPHIAVGDSMEISDQQGNAFTYRVVQTKIVAPTDTQYLAQDRSKKILTVQTSYPVGTALRRFLAIAEMK